MTEPSLLEREKYCEELDELLGDADKCLQDACDYLGWDLSSVTEKYEPYITCPFNDGHSVPKMTIEKHLKKCEWNTLGYTKECVPLPEPCLPLESPSSIKFDMDLQHRILQTAKMKNPELNIGVDEKLIPQTSDRFMSDFTRDERKAMYEYVVANTVSPDIGHDDIADINKPEKSSKENQSTPIIELLAQERNLKRRRAKHRGVHTNKKSQTEILRELIEQQMDMYKEHISEKFGIPIPETAANSEIDNKEDDNQEINKYDLEEYLDNSSSKSKNTKIAEKNNLYNEQSKSHSKSSEAISWKNPQYHERDYNTYHKHSSHYKNYNNYSMNDQDSWDSSWKPNRRDRERHENHSHDRNRDSSDSRSRKRSRSKSTEKKHSKKSRHRSNERSSHKKHKKDHKKRDQSHDSTSERKHKNSKHKRNKHRSRSRDHSQI